MNDRNSVTLCPVPGDPTRRNPTGIWRTRDAGRQFTMRPDPTESAPVCTLTSRFTNAQRPDTMRHDPFD
jgi:hypothetical protein